MGDSARIAVVRATTSRRTSPFQGTVGEGPEIGALQPVADDAAYGRRCPIPDLSPARRVPWRGVADLPRSGMPVFQKGSLPDQATTPDSASISALPLAGRRAK